MNSFNKTRLGLQFTKLVMLQVWDKGREVDGYNPSQYRVDRYGKWMRFSDYGNTNSVYGWEIDHIYPAARGGSDLLYNLQPLQWQNNRSKGDNLV